MSGVTVIKAWKETEIDEPAKPGSFKKKKRRENGEERKRHTETHKHTLTVALTCDAAR